MQLLSRSQTGVGFGISVERVKKFRLRPQLADWQRAARESRGDQLPEQD